MGLLHWNRKSYDRRAEVQTNLHDNLLGNTFSLCRRPIPVTRADMSGPAGSCRKLKRPAHRKVCRSFDLGALSTAPNVKTSIVTTVGFSCGCRVSLLSPAPDCEGAGPEPPHLTSHQERCLHKLIHSLLRPPYLWCPSIFKRNHTQDRVRAGGFDVRGEAG